MRLSERMAASALAALLAASCNTITEEMPDRTSPNAPTTPTTAGAPVVVVPVPLPTPTTGPTPAPGPTPGPNPTPNPAPTPAPPTGGCHLPAGTGTGHNCPREFPRYLDDLEAAIDQLIREQPALFDLRSTTCSVCPKVLDAKRYHDGVIARLEQRGYCAIFDGAEIGIKKTNQFNDQHNVLTSSGFVRRGGGSYLTTCYPAWF